MSSLFGSAGATKPTESLFGKTAPSTGAQATSLFGGTSGSLFGGTTTAQPVSQSAQPTGQQSTSLFGTSSSTKPQEKSLFGGGSMFGTSAQTSATTTGLSLGKGTSLTTKKFLPGRPSLLDVLSVAPSWKQAFDDVNKELSERDEYVAKLKELVRDLRAKSEAQATLLEEKLEISRIHQRSQNNIESEVDTLLPSIQKLQRQCSTLSSLCERTMQRSSNQTLVVPQPEYLRFINDLNQRVQTLQERALCLSRTVSLLSDELHGSSSSSVSDIKTTLSLLMAQYRQIKLRQLGLHEELQAAIDHHKQGSNLEWYIGEDSAETARRTPRPLNL